MNLTQKEIKALQVKIEKLGDKLRKNVSPITLSLIDDLIEAELLLEAECNQ